MIELDLFFIFRRAFSLIRAIQNWKKSGFNADRSAGIMAAVKAAKIDPIGTNFYGKSNLDMKEFKECAKKAMAIYSKNPW